MFHGEPFSLVFLGICAADGNTSTHLQDLQKAFNALHAVRFYHIWLTGDNFLVALALEVALAFVALALEVARGVL